MKKNKKLYVIVDNALKGSQKAVQASHAVAQYCLDHPKTEWSNGILVLLRASNIEELQYLAESCFYEPDLGNRLTAISFLGGDDKVKGFRLL